MFFREYVLFRMQRRAPLNISIVPQKVRSVFINLVFDYNLAGPRRCICEGSASSGFSRSLFDSPIDSIFSRSSSGGLNYGKSFSFLFNVVAIAGDDWSGAGLYCNDQTSDLVYCNINAECRFAEHCQRGCFSAPGTFTKFN